MSVLGEVEGMVGASERGLQVAQQRVDHAIDAKDNFDFERVVALCRSEAVLDLRRKK